MDSGHEHDMAMRKMTCVAYGRWEKRDKDQEDRCLVGGIDHRAFFILRIGDDCGVGGGGGRSWLSMMQVQGGTRTKTMTPRRGNTVRRSMSDIRLFLGPWGNFRT